jgi:hypothetical protein
MKTEICKQKLYRNLWIEFLSHVSRISRSKKKKKKQAQSMMLGSTQEIPIYLIIVCKRERWARNLNATTTSSLCNFDYSQGVKKTQERIALHNHRFQSKSSVQQNPFTE